MIRITITTEDGTVLDSFDVLSANLIDTARVNDIALANAVRECLDKSPSLVVEDDD